MQTFWDGLLSLSIMHLRFIQVVESVNSWFFFIAVCFSIIGYDTICVIYSPSKDTWLVSSFGNYDACLGPAKQWKEESKTRVKGSPHSLGSQILWLERNSPFSEFWASEGGFWCCYCRCLHGYEFFFSFFWLRCKKREKKPGDSPYLLSPLLLEGSLSVPMPDSGFWVALIPGQKIPVRKMVKLLLIWWCFKFWPSSPICMLLFTFQSPQVAVPWILSRLGQSWDWNPGGLAEELYAFWATLWSVLCSQRPPEHTCGSRSWFSGHGNRGKYSWKTRDDFVRGLERTYRIGAVLGDLKRL